MTAGRPTRDHYGSLNAVLGTLRVEPVERCSQLVRDLCQARLRGKSVPWQRCRPAVCQSTLGEAGKYLLTAPLPVASVYVDEARRFRVGGWIQVPLRPFSWTKS